MTTTKTFSDTHPAETDEQRRMVWASLDESLIQQKVAQCTQMASGTPWLQSLFEMGGFALPSHEQRMEGHDPQNELNRHRQLLRVAIQAALEVTVVCEEDAQACLDEWRVATLSAGKAFRSFHRQVCERLVADDVVVPGSKWEPAMVDVVARTMALAAMLDDGPSVALLAAHRPEAMQHLIDGESVKTCAFTESHQSNIRKVVNGNPQSRNYVKHHVTPFFFAMQFSSMDSVNAMLDAGYPASMPLGRQMTVVGPGDPFGIDSIADHVTPTCHPSVYERVLARRLESATDAEVSDVCKNALAVVGEKEHTRGAQYIPAMARAGVFDAHPALTLGVACEAGNVQFVERMLAIVNWDDLDAVLGTRLCPAARAVRASGTADDRRPFDRCGALVVKAAVAAGRGDVMAEGYEGTMNFEPVLEPALLAIQFGQLETLSALLNAGLDPDRRVAHHGKSTAEHASDIQNGAMDIIRAHKAKIQARALLQDMGVDCRPHSI